MDVCYDDGSMHVETYQVGQFRDVLFSADQLYISSIKSAERGTRMGGISVGWWLRPRASP